MASLYRNSQGIILIENDRIQEICKNLLFKKSHNIEEMNDIISHLVSSILLPCLDVRRKRKISSTCENQFDFFVDAMEVLLGYPEYKLMEILAAPIMPEDNKEFSTESWEGLEKRLF